MTNFADPDPESANADFVRLPSDAAMAGFRLVMRMAAERLNAPELTNHPVNVDYNRETGECSFLLVQAHPLMLRALALIMPETIHGHGVSYKLANPLDRATVLASIGAIP